MSPELSWPVLLAASGAVAVAGRGPVADLLRDGREAVRRGRQDEAWPRRRARQQPDHEDLVPALLTGRLTPSDVLSTRRAVREAPRATDLPHPMPHHQRRSA